MSIDLGINTDEPRRPRYSDGAGSGSRHPWWFWALIVPCGLLASCCTLSSLMSPNTNPGSFVGAGQEGRIAASDGTSIYAAADYPANEELITAVNANDGQGVVELLAAGRVIMLSAGTRVLVLDRHFSTVEIRVMEGKHAGKKAIIATEQIGGL